VRPHLRHTSRLTRGRGPDAVAESDRPLAHMSERPAIPKVIGEEDPSHR